MNGKSEVCRKNRIRPLLLLVLALVVISSVIGVSYARYLKSREAKGVLSSSVMYFESDYLSKEGKEYTITGDSVTFHLMNYPDNLRVSEVDVDYTVSVEPAATLSTSQGTLSASQKSSAEITVSGMQPGKTYTVTAVGQNGYSETLTATFTVSPEKTGIFHAVEQNDHFVLLTVSTENISGDVTITFPNGLIPDNTDAILAGVTLNAGSFVDQESFEKAYSSRTYRFFTDKDDNTSYSAENFTVEIAG